MTATHPLQSATYQAALDAVHEHCDRCTKCHEARLYGTWPTTACSLGKRLRRDALGAYGAPSPLPG